MSIFSKDTIEEEHKKKQEDFQEEDVETVLDEEEKIKSKFDCEDNSQVLDDCEDNTNSSLAKIIQKM